MPSGTDCVLAACGMMSRCPTEMRFGFVMLLARSNSGSETPNCAAIAASVSPARTMYVSLDAALVAGGGEGGVGPRAVGADVTGFGAADALGMSKRCPTASVLGLVRLLAC